MQSCYDPAPLWRGGEGCADGDQPGTEALVAWIDEHRESWPTASVPASGFSCRPNRYNARLTSMHGLGRSWDIFFSDRGHPHADGQRLFEWLVRYASDFGVQYVTYYGRDWSCVSGYGKGTEHRDHLHLEQNVSASRSLTRAKIASVVQPSPAPAPKEDDVNICVAQFEPAATFDAAWQRNGWAPTWHLQVPVSGLGARVISWSGGRIEGDASGEWGGLKFRYVDVPTAQRVVGFQRAAHPRYGNRPGLLVTDAIGATFFWPFR